MATKSIFFTGATGYIGGAFLNRLLSHPERSSFSISILVRDVEKAEKFKEQFGLNPIVGSLDNFDLLEEAASKADIVVHTAHADHLGAIKAILAGTKRRYTETGQPPILIHTSGTGVLMDDANGMYVSDVIYSDINVQQIESIPESAIHRNVDLQIVSADSEGFVRAYIVLPGLIYGLAKGPVFDAGHSNPHSIAIPFVIKVAIQHGHVSIPGEGKNVWINVHIDDVADLYTLLFDAARKDPQKIGHGREGYYFGENDELAMSPIASSIHDALTSVGKITEQTVVNLTREEAISSYGGAWFGSNSRGRADRARRDLGWSPKYKNDDLLASIKTEVDTIISKI